jgi:hypothetical protein
VTENDVKSELSYAILHAIAAQAGFSCEYGNRHADNMGIDATIRVKERFTDQDTFTEFAISFQLKATSQDLPLNDGLMSFRLAIDHYDKLRTTELDAPRYLALLRMPADRAEWLALSGTQMVCKRSLFWLSLRTAPALDQDSATVYVPEANVLTPTALRTLAARRARDEWVDYD